MKRFFFLAAVLLVLGAGSIFAQNRGGGRPNGGGQAPTGGMSGGQRAEGIPSQRPNDSTGNRRQRSEGTSQGSSGNGENRGQRPEGIRNGDLKRLGLSDERKSNKLETMPGKIRPIRQRFVHKSKEY